MWECFEERLSVAALDKEEAWGFRRRGCIPWSKRGSLEQIDWHGRRYKKSKDRATDKLDSV